MQRDKDTRSRILTKLEQDPDITHQKLTEECQRIVNLKHDNTKIEEKDISQVHDLRLKVRQEKIKNDLTKPNPCFGCGGLHFKSVCFFYDKSCFCRGFIGHRSTHFRTRGNFFNKPNTRSNVKT